MPQLCACGCGNVTPVVARTDRAKGHVRGEHARFCRGHRSPRVSYVVDPETGCWEWAGSLQSKGYGKAKRHGRTMLAHRLIYEQEVGPIPEGLHLDHLCKNRRCVNPAHLEAVTVAENNRRSPPWSVKRPKVAT